MIRRLEMKTLFSTLLLLISMSATAVTFEELGDSMDEPIPPRVDEGVVRQINFADRTIVVGGYEYLVGPSTLDQPVEVNLYATSAGAFELLRDGMLVEVEYIDFGHARVAFRISELSPDAEIDH